MGPSINDVTAIEGWGIKDFVQFLSSSLKSITMGERVSKVIQKLRDVTYERP